MPLIRIRDLKNGLSTETNFDGPFEQRFVVREGDFLIGMDGEFGCFEWRGPDGLLNQRVCKLTDFAAGIEPRFLFYGINSYLKEIEDVTTFTTVKHLSSKQIAAIEFPLPPFEEQRRIVAVLDEALAAIATAITNAEKNLANARELFELERDAIVNASEPSWTEGPLGEICETQYGISGSMNQEGKGYKIFRMGEVQDGQLLDTGAMKYIDIPQQEFEIYQLHKGDVLFNRTNSIALVGKTGIFLLDGPYCFASYLIRVNFDPARMSSRFACHMMNSRSFLHRVRAKGAQSVNQTNINATILRNERVHYPKDVAAQEALADKLDSLWQDTVQLAAVYEKKLAHLAALKQALLLCAFGGELTAREALAA